MTELHEYIKKISTGYMSGISTEHSYRGDLKELVDTLVKDIIITNEPKRQECGAPDYIIQKDKVPVGYIEAKDIGIDLDKIEKSEQMKRYLNSLDNLILTDYLDFRFFKYGQKVKGIKLGTFVKEGIRENRENFDSFITHINDFCSFKGQTIKSSEKLARMMAQKARMMEEVIFKAVKEESDNNSLKDQLKAFREILIHDLDEKTFADIYAQTIAYGMFAARLHDKSIDTFTREEALFLIPKSNPFLRQLFSYVAGPELDDRVVWIVNDLADIFRATDVKDLLKDFGTATGQNDPFLHFYETFLGEYDSALRKSRGVYYTPEPVVNFIVRAVDDILKDEFKIPQGLADTSKVKIKRAVEGTAVTKGRNKGADVYEETEVHKVQILDPASGTGTFLAEVVKHIYNKFKGQEGVWANYIEEHLIPRLNGFEILMASYTMCHLKLEMLLNETGYKPKDENKQQRLRVFLTNSLEEAHPDTGTLFASWLSKEANAANNVKRDTPIMVVIGNPPYSGESENKGEWIMNQIEDYKKEPGGIEKLQEKNSKWINDDYVKFIRYGQYFIEKNQEGILAFINNHSFLDNPTFRGMRWNLLKSFDKIFIIDLHGNAKKKEICPDGSKDENVFDIQQGVSINIFIKNNKKKKDELAKVFHYDLYGERVKKYGFLWKNSLKTINNSSLKLTNPLYLFVQKNNLSENEYLEGFNVEELFIINSLGLLTKRDNLSIDFDTKTLLKKLYYFLDKNKTTEEVCNYFNIVIKDKDKWDAKITRDIVKYNNIENQIKNILYRPFDNRKVIYNEYFVARLNKRVLNHLIKDNFSVVICRQGQAVGSDQWDVIYTTNYLIDQNIYRRGGGTVFPLYLYPEDDSLDTGRTPNLNMEIVNQVAKKIGLKFTAEKEIPLAPFEKGGIEDESAFEKGGEDEEEDEASPLSQRGFRGLNKVNPDMDHMPYNPELKERSRELRKNMTAAEKKIWYELLSEDKMAGLRFLRQKPIGNFIADFYCSKLLLVIEIDGDSHEEQKTKGYDEERTKILNDYGIKVLRYTNDQIMENLDWVASDLKKNIEKRIKELSEDEKIPPAPFEKGGRGEGNAFEKGGEEERNEASPLFQRGFRGLASDNTDTFSPIDILDYIYAVLHSPKYREKYKEFLKIDFPRVPYPENKDLFRKLVKLGGEIRTIHLLENTVVDKYITTFPVNGDNKVMKVTYENGKVWINKEQYFDKVPEVAWNFYIGGYQPAQKWLKDRKERVLTFDDIMHYQKIIVALKETDRLMREVDGVIVV